MSIIKVDYGQMSGGSNVKRGTLTTDTASEEYTIDTELGSALKRITMWGISNVYPEITQGLMWDSSNPTKFNGMSSNANSGLGHQLALTSSAGASYCVIKNVTDGVIKFLTPSNASYKDIDFIWYAE